MTIESVPLSKEPPQTAASRLKAAFVFSLGSLLVAVRTIFLPHLLAGLGLFVLCCYASYKTWLGAVPFPLSWLAWLVVLGVFGFLALCFALLASLVFALRSAAVNVEDFLYTLFASVKDSVRAKIDSMDEGIAKQQAKVILDNSLREVFAPLKELRFNTLSSFAAGLFVSCLTLVSRAVFLARLARLPAATVQFSAVFASRATLVGALILNFRWLSTLFLWLLYAAGGLVAVLMLWVSL